MLLRTIISPPGTEATPSTSSTIPIIQSQLLSLVAVGTIVMRLAIHLTLVRHSHTKHHWGPAYSVYLAVKCEPPLISHRENVNISGCVSPALENFQISVSCLPGYGLPHSQREVISTCTSEAVWLPDPLDLECQRKLVNDHNSYSIGDCGELSSVSGVYRILNQTNTTSASYSKGSLMEFQCVHTPYEVDPLFTTECQAGQWNPHPRDICDQGVTVMEYYGNDA